ncbi:MAG TPA: TolC family protein, partial [Myxococcales bacterium]
MNAVITRQLRGCLSISLAAAVLATPFAALALQPLEAFIQSSRQHSPDNDEARANLAQQKAQADVALGRVLPGISARGNYQRNQYQSTVSVPIDPNAPPQTITITPYDQLFGAASVNVTLVDLASFVRISAARSGAEASAKQAEAT